MGMHQKKKQFLTHLASKGATLYKASHQVGAKIAYIPVEFELVPSAWSYDNTEGTIWLEDPGKNGYDTNRTGQIEVREPIGLGAIGEIQGGTYDNR